MEKQEAEQLANWLEGIWKSNLGMDAKMFWTNKTALWLAGGGWALQVKAAQFGVEAV